MFILPVDSSVNHTFGAISLPKSKKVEADRIIIAYAKDNNLSTRDALVDIYRAAIEKQAKNRFIGKAFGDDYKQDLFLNLLIKVEEVKKFRLHPSIMLNKMLNSVKSTKSIFDGEMSRLDMMNKDEILFFDKSLAEKLS